MKGNLPSLKRMRDEIRALKSAQPVNGGNLTKHSAQASLQVTVDKENPISSMSLLAAFKATYTRTDGILKPPLVQFSFSLSPDDEYASNSGGMVISFGENSVSYRMCLYYGWWPFDYSETTGSVRITCSAYSPVEGNLTIERVYS